MQGIPRQLTAGETLVFALAAPSESGESYALCLGSLEPVPLTFTDGAWRGEMPAELTSRLAPGAVTWQMWQTAPAHRVEDSGTIRIKPSLLLGHDTRTHEEQVLAALKDALLDLAAGREAEISIHNRTVKFQDPKKIQEMIDHYQMLVNMRHGIGPIICMPVVIR